MWLIVTKSKLVLNDTGLLSRLAEPELAARKRTLSEECFWNPELSVYPLRSDYFIDNIAFRRRQMKN